MPNATRQKIRIRYTKKTPPSPKRGKIWFILLFVAVVSLVAFSIVFSMISPDPAEEKPTEEKESATVEDTPSTEEEPEKTEPSLHVPVLPSWIEPRILEIDGESRDGEKLEAVRNIVVHYVGNPGTTAMGNWNWFASPESDTSSHFIVGLEGEIIQCIPLDEKSCATNERNRDTISVEVCHPDKSGKFSDITRASLIRLLSWLCKEYGFTEESLIRHYDVTGKECPLYYVKNEDEWLLLKADVKRALEGEILWEE